MAPNILGNKVATTALTVTGILTLGTGIAGLVWWFYKRLNRATRMDSLSENVYKIEQLCSTIETLRKEIEELKACKSVRSVSQESETGNSSKRTKSVRFKKTNSILSSSDTEYQSAWSGTEDSSEEFYDFSDSEDFQDENLPSENGTKSNQEEALEIFEQVDTLLEGSSDSHQIALNLLLENEKDLIENVEFLWRTAKCYRMVAQASVDDVKKNLSYRAVEYGKRAVQANENSAEAHKWFAISLGSISEYLGVAEKIRNGFTFKAHIDKAVAINPSDALLYHLLGRFCYEVSMLSWIERKVAATIYSNLPAVTIEEALEHFQNAERLRAKPWKENRLFLARCYVQLGCYSDAIYWIDKALQVPVVTAEDEVAQNELQTLERKYSGYRR